MVRRGIKSLTNGHLSKLLEHRDVRSGPTCLNNSSWFLSGNPACF
jgi:hypothetical protein